MKSEIDWITKRLKVNEEDQKNCTKAKYDQLSAFEKNIHQKAFVNNRNDPFYHQLTTHQYQDGNAQREVKIPKGDVLHQFRQDVQNNQLPTVSWIVAPENFSDHPSSAWYGAWYISEVMEILTKNPEIWKKTIFILTYDENDGYYDHIPPFVVPHPHKQGTGLVSKNIQTGVEYVANETQQSIKNLARESSIGLGFRVPLVVASPWSRGGWVNSEIFDHTSSLRFLEKFLSHKLGKKIEESNITAWRRTVCGDLTSVFRPYNGEKLDNPDFLSLDEFVEGIHKAQFKNPPSNFKRLSKAEIEKINTDPISFPLMASQEKGIRSSCAIPYELYADGKLSTDRKSFQISFKAGNKVFGPAAAGSPFHVYAPGKYRGENVRTWAYAVSAGDELKDTYVINDFENGIYRLRVYGPNGFFREFSGNENDPLVDVIGLYEMFGNKPTGKLALQFNNKDKKLHSIFITDKAYGAAQRTVNLGKTSSSKEVIRITLDTKKSFGWYDFSVRINGHTFFERRYAGRVETGMASRTDPFMGRVVS